MTETLTDLLVGQAKPKEAEIERALMELAGFRWYKCIIDKESRSFRKGDRSRSGWVLFEPSFEEGRIKFAVHGLRLAASKDGSPNEELKQPRPWHGEGELTSSDGAAFKFTWSSHGQDHGTNHETILVDELSSLWPGTFENWSSKDEEAKFPGEPIKGTVQYSRILKVASVAETNGEPWIPVGVAPLFRLGLSDEVRLRWGERLAKLIASKEEFKGSPYIVVDIVSGKYQFANQLNIIDTSDTLLEENPGSVLFVASHDFQPLGRFGLRATG